MLKNLIIILIHIIHYISNFILSVHYFIVKILLKNFFKIKDNAMNFIFHQYLYRNYTYYFHFFI